MNLEELKDLVNELKTQDNLATSHPLFLVQQTHRIWGMDEGYADSYRWIDPDSEGSYTEAEAKEHIREYSEEEMAADAEIDLDELGWRQCWFVDRREHVTTHLTRRAAELYIKQNSHNLNDPIVWVSSQYRCYEWIDLIEFLPHVVEQLDHKERLEAEVKDLQERLKGLGQ